MNLDIRDRILITTTTVTSLAALTIAVTPLFAQTRGTTQSQNSPQQQQQQMTHDMAQMMEKCKSKMSQKMKGRDNHGSQGQHNQHSPSNTKANKSGSDRTQTKK